MHGCGSSKCTAAVKCTAGPSVHYNNDNNNCNKRRKKRREKGKKGKKKKSNRFLFWSSPVLWWTAERSATRSSNSLGPTALWICTCKSPSLTALWRWDCKSSSLSTLWLWGCKSFGPTALWGCDSLSVIAHCWLLFCMMKSPQYNRTGWLGVKHKVTCLLHYRL